MKQAVLAKSNMKLLALYSLKDNEKKVKERIKENLYDVGALLKDTGGLLTIECSDELYKELYNNYGDYYFYGKYKIGWDAKDGASIETIAIKGSDKIWRTKKEVEKNRNEDLFNWAMFNTELKLTEEEFMSLDMDQRMRIIFKFLKK